MARQPPEAAVPAVPASDTEFLTTFTAYKPGMASDGRWRGSIFLGYRNGKPHRKYVTRRTRTAVATDLRRLLEAHRQGQLGAH
jgi:hypothetical protein